MERRTGVTEYEHRTLVVRALKPSQIVMRLEWPLNAPLGTAWQDATERLVQSAFLDRPICLVAPDPQLKWGDTMLEELGLPVTRGQYQQHGYKSVFSPSATPGQLSLVSQSTDFRHGALQISAAPTTDRHSCTEFVRVIQLIASHYPDAKKWQRVSPEEREAVFQRVEAAKLTSQYEFMECDHDWDSVYWYFPNQERLRAVRDALRGLAVERGWRLAIE